MYRRRMQSESVEAMLSNKKKLQYIKVGNTGLTAIKQLKNIHAAGITFILPQHKVNAAILND